MELTVVIPALNEEEIIRETIENIEDKAIKHKLIVVNDHSTDSTEKIVKELMNEYKNISLVNNKRDRGLANALITGIENVKTDLVVFMMADKCDDPGTLKLMLDKIKEGYDAVAGSRYIKGGARKEGTFLQGIISKFLGWMMNLTGIPTKDTANAFKMYKTKILKEMKIEEKGFACSLEMIVKAYKKGYKIAEVPTVWHGRTKGTSSFRILKVAKGYVKWFLKATF